MRDFDYNRLLKKRVDKVRRYFLKKNIRNIYISNLADVYYLTGFKSTAGEVVITDTSQYFIIDMRYFERAAKEVQNFQIIKKDKPTYKILDELRLTHKKLYIDSENCTIYEFEVFRKKCKKIKVLNDCFNLKEFRAVKDDYEIELIRKSAEITDSALEKIQKTLKPGISEIDIKIEFDYVLKKLGADDTAFDTIVLTGANTSNPHGISGNCKIKKNDMILIDCGSDYKGYKSDITRMFFVGKIDAEIKKNYNSLLKIQIDTLSMLKNRIKISNVEKYTRKRLEKIGVNKYFTHSLGHGVGIDIHEQPGISVFLKKRLKKNNVITIEPGIYFPGKFGIRIEDLVVIKNNSYEVLTKFPKEIKDISC